MNIAYWLILFLSLALCTAWLAVRANKRGMKLAPVFTGVLLGSLLAFVQQGVAAVRLGFSDTAGGVGVFLHRRLSWHGAGYGDQREAA